jgi:hypothetical protein
VLDLLRALLILVTEFDQGMAYDIPPLAIAEVQMQAHLPDLNGRLRRPFHILIRLVNLTAKASG